MNSLEKLRMLSQIAKKPRRFKFLYRVFFFSVLLSLARQLFVEQKKKWNNTCVPNLLGCGSSRSYKNIGLLLTKDDGKILESWFMHNSRYFTALVVLDGSINGKFTRSFFNHCESVFYYHESEFKSLQAFSDGELRELGHKLISNLFGDKVWITMAHTDEFYIHSPFKIIDRAEKEGADFVMWQALHVLPHPSEYENYLRNPNAPVTEIFRHYHHFGPSKGAFLEARMFFSSPGLRWEQRQGSIIPMNLKRSLSVHPSYLHYKVHDLSLDAYTPDGIHRNHWNRVPISVYKNPQAKRGVGIRWKVNNSRDFFVEHFPNSRKYTHVSEFRDNSIESYLDIGEIYKDTFDCKRIKSLR